jgi:hypothetical protein
MASRQSKWQLNIVRVDLVVVKHSAQLRFDDGKAPLGVGSRI